MNACPWFQSPPTDIDVCPGANLSDIFYVIRDIKDVVRDIKDAFSMSVKGHQRDSDVQL